MARRASSTPADDITATASSDHSMRVTVAFSRTRSPSSAAMMVAI